MTDHHAIAWPREPAISSLPTHALLQLVPSISADARREHLRNPMTKEHRSRPRDGWLSFYAEEIPARDVSEVLQ